MKRTTKLVQRVISEHGVRIEHKVYREQEAERRISDDGAVYVDYNNPYRGAAWLGYHRVKLDDAHTIPDYWKDIARSRGMEFVYYSSINSIYGENDLAIIGLVEKAVWIANLVFWKLSESDPEKAPLLTQVELDNLAHIDLTERFPSGEIVHNEKHDATLNIDVPSLL